MPRNLLIFLTLVFWCPLILSLEARPLAADEQVFWFPALATPHRDGWNLSLSGLVTEDEDRSTVSWMARKLLGFSDEELSSAERAIFNERTKRFFADDERGKRIHVALFGKRYSLGNTGRDGRFEKTIRLSRDLLRPGQQTIPAVVFANRRSVSNSLQICAVPRQGISIVSDVDDTIKVSNVRDKDALMRNTFLRPFHAVDGMAEVYQRWETNSGAQFHYVSGSPWQLFPALNGFIATNQFPAGSWHLRSVRLVGISAFELLKTPDVHKRAMIEELFARLPERKFVLVGDSGERDPEIYGDLARRHPKRILQIFIRDVTDEPITSERYVTAFKSLPKDSCVIFKGTEELPFSLNRWKEKQR